MDITKLTAQYLSNRKLAGKMNGPDATATANNEFLKAVEFYKDRSLELTEALLNNRAIVEPHLTKDVLTSFNTYMRACICFFRTTDMNDLHQTEYVDINNRGGGLSTTRQTKTEKEQEEEAMQELDDICGDGPDIPYHAADTVMMRQIKIAHNAHTLDRFLKYEKSEAPIILPKQREIDLEHPTLKTKPFFPPPPHPEPSPAVDEVRCLATNIIEEILQGLVEKLQQATNLPPSSLLSEPEPTSPEPTPTQPAKKKAKKVTNVKNSKKKKQDSKQVEALHIDI
jgi:hypothetical protein